MNFGQVIVIIILILLILSIAGIITAIVLVNSNQDSNNDKFEKDKRGDPRKWSKKQKGDIMSKLHKNVKTGILKNVRYSKEEIDAFLNKEKEFIKKLEAAVKCLLEYISKKYEYSYVKGQFDKNVIDVGFKRDLEAFSEPCLLNNVIKTIIIGLEVLEGKCKDPKGFLKCVKGIKFSNHNSSYSDEEYDKIDICFKKNCSLDIKRRKGSPGLWKQCEKNLVKKSLLEILWTKLKDIFPEEFPYNSELEKEMHKVAECMTQKLSTDISYPEVANNLKKIVFSGFANFLCPSGYDTYERDHNSNSCLKNDCGYNRLLTLADYISHFLHTCTSYYYPGYQGKCHSKMADSYAGCMFKNFPKEINTKAAGNMDYDCMKITCPACLP